ncbi:hypothetical protein [Natronorubrum sp. DTA28]|uniref:hypothetical protein n=1 Tax=Natronorubrum sp. DTA28 TaxID=3447019 RepID=UPI003F8350B8
MATHGFQRDADAGVSLPEAVPFDQSQSSRLSWELGSQVVDGNDVSLCGEWTRPGRTWRLSIFRVLANTAVVCVRTPVGRERFYSLPRRDVESAMARLESASQWHRLE